MYKITEEYKQYIENKTSLVPKCKIVVDGIEYTGKVIKTVPKISHSAEKMIGSFPIRTCSFDIYDMDNSLNFENKEIYVFKGLLVNNEIEYIPQGVFIAEADKITTDITKRTISFNNIQDRTIKFDAKYETKLDWSINHTGLEIIEEICEELEIPLETKEFNWYNYEFKQPNFLENCTYREVVSRMAEIGGGIAFISRTGGLVIKSQQTTDHFIYRKRYENLTRENEFGVINTIILGKDGIDDDIVYSSSAEGNKVEWKILDNPFVDLYREEMIERVAQYILGLNLTPFSLTGFVDGSYLDLNDTIEIIDKNNKIFKGVILNYENTSRIKSTIGANTQNTLATNYNLAGSQKQEMRNVKLQVDHNNNTITGLVEEVEGQNEKISQLEIDIDGIRQEVSEITDLTIKGDTTEAKLNLDNVGEGYLFKLEIHPYFEDIAELYPNQEIFPNDEMFLDDSKGDVHIAVTYPSSSIYPNYDTFTRTKPSMLKIENITTGDIMRYEIPTELYFLNENTYDILEYSYGKEKCTITKNVGFKNGIPYKLEEPIIEEYDFPLLETKNGNYLVELEDYSSGYIYCEMLGQTNYSEVFATKVELKSSITQTNEKIDLEVKNMQEYVDGSAETLESKITQTATDITSEVNSYKESTDGQIEELNSKIIQTTESIESTVSKYQETTDEKITDIESRITQTVDEITQSITDNVNDINSTITQKVDSLTTEINKKVNNDTFNSRISQTESEISGKVSQGDFGSLVQQYYNKVLIGFNNNSSVVQLATDGISLYRSGNLRVNFDEYDLTFYQDGYSVGNIGSQFYAQDNSQKALAFSLDSGGAYMGWFQRTSSSSNYYSVMYYARAGKFGKDQEGIYFTKNVYGNGYSLSGFNMANAIANNYETVDNKNINVITNIDVDEEGNLIVEKSSIGVRSGMITSVPDNAEEVY